VLTYAEIEIATAEFGLDETDVEEAVAGSISSTSSISERSKRPCN
jgi:hypothetical protein